MVSGKADELDLITSVRPPSEKTGPYILRVGK